MVRLSLCALVVVAACARPLTPNEKVFLAGLFGDELVTAPVRIRDGAIVSRAVTFRREPRPRLSCQDRIWPPPEVEEGLVTVEVGGFVLFNHVFTRRVLYAEDYLPKMPEKMSLPAAMFLAHEMTHVWQWQNRDRTGYHPLIAAAEHRPGEDPYLFDPATPTPFLLRPYEQQAAIVEEYVCCRALDADGARTERLRDLIEPAIPVSRLDEAISGTRVFLPWKEAKIGGICS